MSAYVRKAALQKDIVVIDGLRELIPQLNAIGNNLNQQTVIMRVNQGNAPHIDEMKISFCNLMDTLSERMKGGKADSNNQDQ